MIKAAVLGASGGIGQPLSLLLKTCPIVDELALYDVVNTHGVAIDLSHISTVAKISGYLPKNDGLKKTLLGTDVVIIPAGIPRKPGMTRDDLFKINAGIVKTLVEAVAEFCPQAFILIISNPVNSTVPIAAEILKIAGVFDPKRLFGVTTLDVIRAEAFIRDISGRESFSDAIIPVIGGHSGETIVPLFSLATPKLDIPADDLEALVNRVQFGGDEVVKAKDGAGSATLSMAYAGFRFAEKIINAIKGGQGIIEPTYICLRGVPGGEAIAKETGLDYFSVPVEFGKSGAERATNPLPLVNDYERTLIRASIDGLRGNITKGIEFVHDTPSK